MDPSACRVIYIDDRFNTERWISREGLTPTTPKITSQYDVTELPPDLQANVNAFLSVFNQVFVCNSGRSFSAKLGELHDQVKLDCTPIIACFDVGRESRHGLKPDNYFRARPRPSHTSDPDGPPSPYALRREITFSSESDESYGLQLLSRIASDLQVEEGVRLIIPVAVVKPKRKDSYDHTMEQVRLTTISRAPHGSEAENSRFDDQSDIIDPPLMLQCLEAGALDVVRSPLDRAGIMGLTVHAFRVYKSAKKEQASFMAAARRGRKQSWVGVEEEKPYAYLREAMVKKLLKGICEPQNVIEDYQHRDLYVEPQRKPVIAEAVGKWTFDGHLFSEDELVYAGYYMLNHAVQLPELEHWRVSEEDLLHFMQGCRVAYNSFVLYHNFRHAVDVLQSLFYFLLQIGTLPPYPVGSEPPPKSQDKSPIAKLLGSFEAMALLISAIGHDVGHPGVNNMFLVKLNAPLAQLYNDQSVLEAFHCAAYSQILRRHWPAAFNDKGLRKLMISSILATDMGVHSDYMQQLGHLQEKIHESQATDGWAPKDIDAFKVLTCGLLIKCADISNVARPWIVAEKWTYLLQKEFAKQGEMEEAVGMETTLFGGPPELGNMLKLANGQIGFMTIFAHPLFANVTDIIPAMSFAADEILTNKGVWFTKAEQEKMKQIVRRGTGVGDGGSVSPRSQSPTGLGRRAHDTGEKRTSYFPTSPLKQQAESPEPSPSRKDQERNSGNTTPQNHSRRSTMQAVAGIPVSDNGEESRRSSRDSGRKSRTKSREVHSAPNGHRESMKAGSPENDDPNRQDALINKQLTGGYNLSDGARDNGVSMRAGSLAVPIPDEQMDAAIGGPSALGSFTFATSDKDEPVRKYDPEQHYPAVHSSARASAPVSDTDIQQKAEMATDAVQTTTAHNGSNTTSTNVRGGGDDNTLTPSHSTEATSYTSDKSEDLAHQQRRNEFEVKRNRAASAPMQVPSPNLRPSFSMSSTQSGSQTDSKPDIHSTLLSNGDIEQGGSSRARKASTRTLGRKRSRIKMGLAFWKKRKGDVDEQEKEEGMEGKEGGPVCRTGP